MSGPLREIPPVHRFTTDPLIAAYESLLGRGNVRSCVANVLDEMRAAISRGARASDFEALRSDMLERLAASQAHGLINVINGTGVLLHTNFGRAPLAQAALDAANQLGSGYTNLEYDLEEGKRGNRYDRLSAQIRELTSAQASVVVNNCAAAVLIVLDTFAKDREVVVSRGQLIEIGGGFRLPDVLRKSGAKLVEVGTTNKTYPHDYRDAWNDSTALFMRTHPSNYRVEGFTVDVEPKILSALAKELGVISFEDLGSGALIDLAQFGLAHEPTVAEEIAAGIDLVAFSGDKLLGGPQCGILCGKADLIAAIRSNPLLRALRVDKLTLATLAATLRLYLEPGRLTEIPLYAMLDASIDALRERASAICTAVRNSASLHAMARETFAATGGGTLPQSRIPSAGVALQSEDFGPDSIAARVRKHQPPVIGRVEGDDFILDVRTIFPREDAIVVQALTHVDKPS